MKALWTESLRKNLAIHIFYPILIHDCETMNHCQTTGSAYAPRKISSPNKSDILYSKSLKLCGINILAYSYVNYIPRGHKSGQYSQTSFYPDFIFLETFPSAWVLLVTNNWAFFLLITPEIHISNRTVNFKTRLKVEDTSLQPPPQVVNTYEPKIGDLKFYGFMCQTVKNIHVQCICIVSQSFHWRHFASSIREIHKMGQTAYYKF